MSEIQQEVLVDNDFDEELEELCGVEIEYVKLSLAEHLAAYKDKKELNNDAETIDCDNNLLERVTSNYVIAKKIISSLPWQDKLMCKQVCTTWHSAVHALKKEQLGPADFVIDLQIHSVRGGIKFKQSNNFSTEPLAVLTFSNTPGFMVTSRCEAIVPIPCVSECEKDHHLLDVVHYYACSPKDCMLTVRASYLSYLPLPTSITYEHSIIYDSFVMSNPFICGVYIPALPNVELKVINVQYACDMKQEFYNVVDQLSQTRVVKGVLAYVTEIYLLRSVEDIVFLNYFKDVQPDVPYAFAGCIVEEAITTKSDINLVVDELNKGLDFVSDNWMSIGIFSVPKNVDNKEEYMNFDMFSVVMESSEWTKAKIQKTINEFSKKVPRYEHSIALSLSCVGREHKQNVELDFFRAAFPHTRIVGCYGSGELGLNHPARPPSTAEGPTVVKRHRRDPGPQLGIMYSYSTVFMYMGWGRVLYVPETT